MKTNNIFLKVLASCGGLLLSFVMLQCTCCPPLSRTTKPSFTGCWLTEYNRPRDYNDPIKDDIVYKEIPVEITQNADGTINGTWWSFPVDLNQSPGTGTLTGTINNQNRITGKWGTEPDRDIDFQLSPTGLTFMGTYGSPSMWGNDYRDRRFYWNGTKVSNCKCPDSITQQNLKNQATNQ